MTPHRDNQRGTLILDRRFPGVGRIKRASGTTDRSIFKSLNGMLDVLWNMGRVDLLRAIQERKLHIMDVWAPFRLGHLNELPDPDSLQPLEQAWLAWVETLEHSTRYKRDCRAAIRTLAPKPKDTIARLPALVMGYRFKAQRQGHATTFRRTKNIAQAFVRDTMGRSHAIYDRLRDIQSLKIHRKEGNPQTPEQARAIRDALGEHGHTWWAMCCSGMMPDEYWGGKWKVGSNFIHIMGTKTDSRNRKVPRICTPQQPTPQSASGFAKALLKASGGSAKPYDARRTFSHWLEEARVTRTRIKLYMGHTAKDITDLYQRHELAAYLESDADLLREYLGEQRIGLKVVKG